MAAGKDKFEVYQDKRGEYRWRRFASNGTLVGAATEGFKSEKDCKSNMNRKTKDSDKWEFYTDKRGEHRWRCKASNGKIVHASSEGYKAKKDAKSNAERFGYSGK